MGRISNPPSAAPTPRRTGGLEIRPTDFAARQLSIDHDLENGRPRTVSVGFARPEVSQLVFRVFDRSVHPELFETYASWTTCQRDYRVRVDLSLAGHVVSVRLPRGTLTELTLPDDHPLPMARCRLAKPIRGSRTEVVESAEFGIRYQLHHQLERTEPEVFLNLHEELVLDCERAEVSHRFATGNRFAPTPVSLVRVDAQRDHLLVHAFHTFPEECAVVRTQSLLEFA
jgi:hypothetical protein